MTHFSVVLNFLGNIIFLQSVESYGFCLKKMLRRSMDFRLRIPQLFPVLVDCIFIQSKVNQTKTKTMDKYPEALTTLLFNN